jgi:hypothetical protein
MKFDIIPDSITTLSIVTVSITTFNNTTLSITTFKIMAPNVVISSNLTKNHVFLNATIYSIKFSGVMPSVIRLNVIMVRVVAPFF